MILSHKDCLLHSHIAAALISGGICRVGIRLTGPFSTLNTYSSVISSHARRILIIAAPVARCLLLNSDLHYTLRFLASRMEMPTSNLKVRYTWSKNYISPGSSDETVEICLCVILNFLCNKSNRNAIDINMAYADF